MAFKDLFKKYPNRNAELRMLAKSVYEFGKNIAQEPSAALTMGLLDAAIDRQDAYLDRIEEMINALAAKPIPDKPGTHPTDYPIDLTETYPQFQTGVNGNQVPLNEQTELAAIKWMELAVEVSKSNSAAIPGGMIEYDRARAINAVNVLKKLMDEFRKRPILDLPETAEPGAPLDDEDQE